MRAIFCLSLVILSVALASSKSKKNAYVEDVSYKPYLSTKTPYRFIGNTDDSEERYTGCSAKRVWAVYRHGTRTVGPGQMDAVYRRLTKIRTAIIRNGRKPGTVARWLPHPELDDEKRLTSIGAEEMIHMGQRFRNRFRSLMPEHWNNRTFVVRATDTTRAQDSARNFLTGLFDADEAQHVRMPTPLKKDPVLRFYKLCPRWRDEVKKNPETKKEVQKFLDGQIVSSVIDSISRRFNLPPGFLTVDDIQLMYTMCAFETSWDRHNESAWCRIFKKNELKVLEYAEDLELYWFDGYGKELNTKIACPMFKDAFAHLSGERKEPFVFYFSHCGTILKFLTHLGLYHDNFDLTNDNFYEHDERMWRTSRIAAFGSNIAFVRYDCIDGKQYILTLHQETPIRLPGCPEESELCSLDTIKELYKNSLENCDYDQICASKLVDDRTYWSSLVNSTMLEHHEEDKS